MRNLGRWLAAIGAIVLLWAVFGPLATLLAGGNLSKLGPKEQIDALNSIRGQIIALFVVIGLYFTGRKYFLDRETQFTDRFNAAVDHLGASDETVRAGGIRALARMLRDSPRDRDHLLETITNFLRQHTRDGEPDAVTTRADLSAAVAALCKPRRTSRTVTEQPMDLRQVRLAGGNLRGIRLTAADLTHADLSGATLADANLTDSALGDAKLTGVTATTTRLRRASLRRADLTDADLTDADCTGADLGESNLCGATLTGTTLTDAVLTGCDLRGTDLSRTRGLTADQLRSAQVDARTRVPEGVAHPLQGRT